MTGTGGQRLTTGNTKKHLSLNKLRHKGGLNMSKMFNYKIYSETWSNKKLGKATATFEKIWSSKNKEN